MSLNVRVTQDGHKNAVVQISGFVDAGIWDEPQVLVDFSSMNPPIKGIKVESIFFSLQLKLGILLWWTPEDLMVPLESRGHFKFDAGLMSPREGWDKKIYYTTSTFHDPSPILIVLDLDKQT